MICTEKNILNRFPPGKLLTNVSPTFHTFSYSINSVMGGGGAMWQTSNLPCVREIQAYCYESIRLWQNTGCKSQEALAEHPTDQFKYTALRPANIEHKRPGSARLGSARLGN